MKLSRSLIILLLGLMMASSCKQKIVYQDYLTKIDSLQNALEEVAVLYESLDTNLLREQYNITGDNLKKIEKI